MEFCRLYRLVYAKRWLITTIMLIAAVVIFVGATLQAQKKTYQADAYIKPEERALNEAVGTMTLQSGQGGGDPTARISDLIMLLRNSHDLHVRAAQLLRLPEGERAAKIQAILVGNGFFDQRDTLIQQQKKQLTTQNAITETAAQNTIDKEIADSHRAIAGSLARASDEYGPFAPTGLAAPVEDLAGQIRESVSYDPVPGPLSTEEHTSIVNLIRIRAIKDREAAANLFANVVCVAFIDFYTEQSKIAIGAQRHLYEMQRDRAKEKLAAARKKWVEFQNRPDVVPLRPEQGTAIATAITDEGQINALEGDISGLNRTIDATTQLLAQQKKVRTDALPSTEDPLVNTLETQVAQAQMNFDSISSLKDVGHPDYIRALAALKTAKEERERLKHRGYTRSSPNTVIDAYKAQLGDAKIKLANDLAKKATLEQQLRKEQAKVAKLPAAQSTLEDLKGEVAIHKQNLLQAENALNMYGIGSVDRDRSGAITMASWANAIQLGSKANMRWLLMTYGAILALIFGIAMVVAMDALDNSIRSTTDVEKLLGLPLCGVIPAQLPDPDRAPRITYLDPLSPVAEAYRSLRTDLLFTAVDRPFKSLMMSTSKPGQGATTTVCNLAIALAQAGKRVILVDSDLRRPKLHGIFRVKNDVGLTSLLNDECEIEEALKATEIDNLLLLPSGPLPLNPSELLASPRMKALHEQLKPHTDFILFDTPSAIAFSDAVVLSSFLDAVLMVIRANDIPRGSEQQVKAMLNKGKANILGVVLNGMNPELVDSVHYHYHYYPVMTPRGTLGGTNGNGHHGGMEIPLALTGEGGAGEPVTTRVAAMAEGAGEVTRPGGAVMDQGERTQTFSSPVQGRNTVQEPFLQEHKRRFWKQIKAAVPYLLVAVLIALLVLVLNNSVSHVPPVRP